MRKDDVLFRRILITGANGLLGQALVNLLSRFPQYDVLATGKDALPRYAEGSCGYTRLDITKPEEIRRLFLDFAPDLVINCAAMTNVDQCEENREDCWLVNVTGVENLVRSCRAHGAHLLQVSTDFIFDGESGPYAETHRPLPVNYYGRSKLAAENAVRSLSDGQWSIARTVLVFGSGNDLGRSNFALWVIDNLRKGSTIKVVTDQWRTPTYAPDLANGIERMVRFRKSGIYHISGREFLSVFEIARTIAKALDLNEELVQPTDAGHFTQVAKRPPRTGFYILKAESELGYKPTPLKEAIRLTARSIGMKLATPS